MEKSRCGGGKVARRRRAREGGLLIAVEGLDGSGKSTQIELLLRHLVQQGLPVHRSNWNSSPAVHPLIRDLKAERRLTPHGFALVHAADFADRYEREILPRLRIGVHVLCDRYVGTALARDGARGLRREWIDALYGFARPADLTFYFRVPPEVAAARILRGRPAFSHYEAGLDLDLGADPYESFLRFQSRVAAHYAAIADGQGYVVIDATLPMRSQQRLVRAEVRRLLGEGAQ